MRDSARREIRKITTSRVVHPPPFPPSGKGRNLWFFVSMAAGIGMETFYDGTFDKVREVTRRARIVRLLLPLPLLLPLLHSCSETLACSFST